MADRTNDERLREITVIAARERARVEEIKRLRAELDAARETIRSKDRLLPSLIAEGVAMERERATTAEAEVERLRNHIDSAGTGFNVALGAIRLSLEQADKDRDALRADLDEAMLLHGGENGKLPVSMRFPEYLDRIAKLRDRWMARREKHTETDQ